MGISLDPASSEFYDNGFYNLRTEQLTCSSEELVSYLEKLVDAYPIVSIEDGHAEDDWDGWKVLYNRLGQKIDDKLTTSFADQEDMVTPLIVELEADEEQMYRTYWEAFACFRSAIYRRTPVELFPRMEQKHRWRYSRSKAPSTDR